LILLLVLPTVLCRPDISLTSGASKNGYDYPKPKIAFEEGIVKKAADPVAPPPTYLPPDVKVTTPK
jgi:hypothetical protein